MNVHLTIKSTNVKTGPIPVSTSSRDTCPDSCSLKKNGCYADSGPLALHWSKVTSGERGMAWEAFCEAIASLPDGQLWRMNQAGDLPTRDNVTIDSVAMRQLIKANTGKNGFTYTHYKPTKGNCKLIQTANNAGFTINLSAESFDQADEYVKLAIGPVVTIMPEGLPRKLKTNAGNTVITCPATYRDDISCATCALCQKQRDTIIGFPVHGTSKAKARKVFMLKQG